MDEEFGASPNAPHPIDHYNRAVQNVAGRDFLQAIAEALLGLLAVEIRRL